MVYNKLSVEQGLNYNYMLVNSMLGFSDHLSL